MIRLLLSIVIGYLLGKERKRNEKAGGSRTMGIMCMSACLIALLTLKIGELEPAIHNFTRLMSYGIASIGFLGSGLIIQSKGHIEGLTSASTIFALMIIGYCIGLGFYFYGIFSAICIYLLLESKYWHIARSKDEKN